MDYKILSSSNPDTLTGMVKVHIEQGWKPIGSHQVVNTHIQNRYAGSQFMDSVFRSEYSQTVVKD